jgi:hypothetical protein
MKTTDPNRIKSRYFSIKNEGHEIYVEDVSMKMSLNILKQTAIKKTAFDPPSNAGRPLDNPHRTGS